MFSFFLGGYTTGGVIVKVKWFVDNPNFTHRKTTREKFPPQGQLRHYPPKLVPHRLWEKFSAKVNNSAMKKKSCRGMNFTGPFSSKM